MGLLRTALHHAEPGFRKKTIKDLDGLKQETKGKLLTIAVHDLSVDDAEKKYSGSRWIGTMPTNGSAN